MRSFLYSSSIFLAFASWTSAAAAPPRYLFHELALPPEATFGNAYDITNSGKIAGAGYFGFGNPRGFTWDGLGSPATTLGPGAATAVNDNGAVVGITPVISGSYVATQWRNGQPIVLGTLGGRGSTPQAVNASGLVVGSSETSPSSRLPTAFFWRDFNGNGQSDAGEMRSLGGLAPGLSSEALDVNDNGEAVGFSLLPENPQHAIAVRWHDDNNDGVISNSERHRIGTLGGYHAESVAINAQGQVVGNSYLKDDLTIHASFWEDANGNGEGDDGEMRDLGSLPNLRNSTALDINSLSEIVGFAYSDTETRATMYLDGQVYDLNALTENVPSNYILTTASGINDQGWIVGYGAAPGTLNQQRPFVLIPVPEPTTATLLIAACLVGARRRQ